MLFYPPWHEWEHTRKPIGRDCVFKIHDFTKGMKYMRVFVRDFPCNGKHSLTFAKDFTGEMNALGLIVSIENAVSGPGYYLLYSMV